jgi:two-component system C4-dicarboxylate transport sensor histidine kinase DctB
MVALLSAKPVDLAGEPCILWQAVDVTARKQTELELAENRDRLEDLVAERTRELERSLDSLKQVERLASIGTLAAGVAHQINNPIASIRAASEFALMCDDEPDAAVYYREALETCVEQSDRCGLIVRNILRFSRGELGARSHVDLRQLIVRSCNVVASYAAENGTTLEIDAGESELPVLVNSIEIEQVFVNVLRNAIESGDGTTRVEVLARRLETGAIVEIRDDGAGIDAAHLPFLFDPFYTTRLERGGTGLGLSVAHGIVNAHGGAIRADTEIDHGTAFQIQIPLEVPTPARPHLVSVS